MMTQDERDEVERGEKSKKKKRKFGHETSFECSICKVSLCTSPCFEMYHTEVDYIRVYLRKTYNLMVPEGEEVAAEGAVEEAE